VDKERRQNRELVRLLAVGVVGLVVELAGTTRGEHGTLVAGLGMLITLGGRSPASATVSGRNRARRGEDGRRCPAPGAAGGRPCHTRALVPGVRRAARYRRGGTGRGGHMGGALQTAGIYDTFVGAFGLAGVDRLRRRLVGNLAGDILEIGVGTGLNLRHYGSGVRVTGIEPAAALLRAAVPRARVGGHALALASAAALPFPDNAFDAVVSPLVFCSIPVPLLRPALAELRRVLRPDGQLLMLEHTRTGRPWCDAAIDAVAALWLRLSGGCHLDRDTPALLVCAGWRLIRHERHALGLYRLLIAVPAPVADADVRPGARERGEGRRCCATPAVAVPGGDPQWAPPRFTPKVSPGESAPGVR